MNAFLPVPLPENELAPGRLLAVLAPHAAGAQLLMLTAYLARRGGVQVLDAGNRFNVYPVARALRRLGSADFTQALRRIRIARAFTCHQVAALLAAIPLAHEPVLVFDLLDTFSDQSTPLRERRRLLESSLGHLRRLAGNTFVLVSVRPPPPGQEDPAGLVQMVQAAADRVWLQEEAPAAVQPRFF